MTSPRHLALEATIIADPEDPAGYWVYADDLQAAGDPRGDLIAVQAVRDAARASRELTDAEATLLAAHGAALLGAAADLEHCDVDWFCGFWRGLYLGEIGGEIGGQSGDDLVAQLLASPSARFLRVLSCLGPFTPRVIELAAPVAATLRALDLSLAPHTAFADADLHALERFTRLSRLVLRSCESITAAGLTGIGGLRELAVLELRDCVLTDDIARAIGHLPLSDTTFTAVSSAFTADGMRALAAAPLRRFHLGNGIDDARLAPLAAHPTLSDLSIHGAQLTATGVRALGSLPRLSRLQLGSSSLTGLDLSPLAPLAGRLESLSVAHSEALGDPACNTLAAFERLTFLDVAATAITGTGLRALARIHSLTQLDVSFLRLDDDDVAALEELPDLRSLNLAYTQLTDRAIDTLVRIPRLEKLDLGGTQITVAAIERLATVPGLIELGLSDCDSDAVARAYDRSEWHVHARDLMQFD